VDLVGLWVGSQFGGRWCPGEIFSLSRRWSLVGFGCPSRDQGGLGR
jgi:hypothetical protein